MPSATTDNNSPIPSEDRVTYNKKKQSIRFRPQPSLIICAVIFAITIIVFIFWGLFFNNTIENKIWILRFSVEGEEQKIGFRFDDENECTLYNGGFVNKGRYSIETGLNGKETLSLELTEYGNPKISNEFYYEITGNSFSGRQLTLTDLSGENLICSITGIDKKNADLVCDYVEEDGKKYYKYTLSSADSYEPEYKHYEDEKTDEELLGIWYCKAADSVYDHTYAFYDNGTLTITFRDFSINGCYTAENGSGKFNVVFGNGSVSPNDMTYEIKDGILTVTMNNVPEECERTDSITPVDTGSK